MEAARRERLATGYRPRHGGHGGQDYLQLGAYWPVGGMASTATDMARWMRFHLNGGALDGTRLTPVSRDCFELSHPMEGSDYYRRLDGATEVFENARGGCISACLP
ncbi:serine hydrolase [Halomonas campisalis]|nr:serine hydrolase [Halomonas campisalis]MDR5863444.1 serine hydrolase [Halomonas campisalis]